MLAGFARRFSLRFWLTQPVGLQLLQTPLLHVVRSKVELLEKLTQIESYYFSLPFFASFSFLGRVF